VSAENLQSLFAKAGLGKLGHNNNCFSFQASKFESFPSIYMVQDACEVTHCKVKGSKTKQWFVRLGTQYIGDLSDPGTKSRAPRVTNIRAKQGHFQDTISKLPSLQQAPRTQEEESKEGKLEESTHVQYATFQKKKESLNHEDSVTSLACLSRLFKRFTLITLLCTK
jgi:hypothetical protein